MGIQLRKVFKKGIIVFVLFVSFSSIIIGQGIDTAKVLAGAPKVFIDANRLDMDYVRKEVHFVNYVNDRMQADIFILVTTIRTGGRGQEYTLTFIGKNQFEGRNDTLVYNSLSTDTKDNIRKGFVKTLKLGLIPYMLDTPLVNFFDVKFNSNATNIEIKDKWDYWVFRTRLRGSVSGEEFRSFYYISGEFDADRITEDWKLRIGGDANYDEDNYRYPDTDAYLSFSRRLAAHIHVVKSLSDHWSLGVYSGFFSSTYRNLQENYNVGPAIEYNFFPYSESTYREIRFSYSISYNYNKYFEETIYGEMEETLFRQRIGINSEFKQPWGQIDVAAGYSSYLHDLTKDRIRLYSDVSVNLFEGFQFSFGVGYSMIHDQISLPARDLDIDEILLRRNEIATQYNYWLRYGISYTFGSIYNNIVNTRFN